MVMTMVAVVARELVFVVWYSTLEESDDYR